MTYHEDTEILYRGMEPQCVVGQPEVMPIYPSTAYCVRDTADYTFANRGGKYLYNRTANPNRDALGTAISGLEDGEKTLLCSSGMAAISTTLLGLLRAGDHILVNRAVYGETIELIQTILSRFQIEASFADFTDPKAVEAALQPNTVLLYTEVITNPLTHVIDLSSMAKIAHNHGALLVVDSTFSTPFLIRPLAQGADLVLHSLTKYFGGHSDLTGGSITGSRSLIEQIQPSQLLLGCCLDPISAWMFSRSIATMAMRVRRQNENAIALAQALQQHPEVRAVYHPSLADHPQHSLATQILSGGYGAILSFQVEDDLERVDQFFHKLKLVRYLGTLGGIRTSVTHPATAFRDSFSEEELRDMGLTDGLIRISVGAEDVDDLIADFRQALE